MTLGSFPLQNLLQISRVKPQDPWVEPQNPRIEPQDPRVKLQTSRSLSQKLRRPNPDPWVMASDLSPSRKSLAPSRKLQELCCKIGRFCDKTRGAHLRTSGPGSKTHGLCGSRVHRCSSPEAAESWIYDFCNTMGPICSRFQVLCGSGSGSCFRPRGVARGGSEPKEREREALLRGGGMPLAPLQLHARELAAPGV